ncbi:MAG: hypothetical protein NTV06_03185 [candidate division Zixibacteria bacterium]|nr:hypothetical protein [candidate division Zixibacteria bacterium]
MLVQFLVFSFLATTLWAGSFSADWPIGKSEKVLYEITLYGPTEVKSYIHLEVSRAVSSGDLFTVTQTTEIPEQTVTIKSIEKYRAADMKLVSSENYFTLPPEAAQQLGTNFISIIARANGDSLAISSNNPIIPSEKRLLTNDLTTCVGAFLTCRNSDFKMGSGHQYHMIDMFAITPPYFSILDMADSVVGEGTVTVPAGVFVCYKVKTMAGGTSYVYYSKEKGRLPIRLEALDSLSGKPISTIILQKYE